MVDRRFEQFRSLNWKVLVSWLNSHAPSRSQMEGVIDVIFPSPGLRMLGLDRSLEKINKIDVNAEAPHEIPSKHEHNDAITHHE